VLKDLGTGKPLFVVLFTLYLKEDVDEDGNLKEGVEGGKPLALMTDDEKKRHEEITKAEADGKKVVDDGAKKAEGGEKVAVETNDDDVD
jgi:hypothetical protein